MCRIISLTKQNSIPTTLPRFPSDDLPTDLRSFKELSQSLPNLFGCASSAKVAKPLSIAEGQGKHSRSTSVTDEDVDKSRNKAEKVSRINDQIDEIQTLVGDWGPWTGPYCDCYGQILARAGLIAENEYIEVKYNGVAEYYFDHKGNVIIAEDFNKKESDLIFAIRKEGDHYAIYEDGNNAPINRSGNHFIAAVLTAKHLRRPTIAEVDQVARDAAAHIAEGTEGRAWLLDHITLIYGYGSEDNSEISRAIDPHCLPSDSKLAEAINSAHRSSSSSSDSGLGSRINSESEVLESEPASFAGPQQASASQLEEDVRTVNIATDDEVVADKSSNEVASQVQLDSACYNETYLKSPGLVRALQGRMEKATEEAKNALTDGLSLISDVTPTVQITAPANSPPSIQTTLPRHTRALEIGANSQPKVISRTATRELVDKFNLLEAEHFEQQQQGIVLKASKSNHALPKWQHNKKFETSALVVLSGGFSQSVEYRTKTNKRTLTSVVSTGVVSEKPVDDRSASRLKSNHPASSLTNVVQRKNQNVVPPEHRRANHTSALSAKPIGDQYHWDFSDPYRAPRVRGPLELNEKSGNGSISNYAGYRVRDAEKPYVTKRIDDFSGNRKQFLQRMEKFEPLALTLPISTGDSTLFRGRRKLFTAKPQGQPVKSLGEIVTQNLQAVQIRPVKTRQTFESNYEMNIGARRAMLSEATTRA
jgi:hypothetical protein